MKEAYSRVELKDLLNAETLSHRAVFVEEFDWLVADAKRDGCVWCRYLELDSANAAAGKLVVRSATTRDSKAVKKTNAAVAARTAFWAELEPTTVQEDSEHSSDSDDQSVVLSPSPVQLERSARLQRMAARLSAPVVEPLRESTDGSASDEEAEDGDEDGGEKSEDGGEVVEHGGEEGEDGGEEGEETEDEHSGEGTGVEEGDGSWEADGSGERGESGGGDASGGEEGE